MVAECTPVQTFVLFMHSCFNPKIEPWMVLSRSSFGSNGLPYSTRAWNDKISLELRWLILILNTPFAYERYEPVLLAAHWSISQWVVKCQLLNLLVRECNGERVYLRKWHHSFPVCALWLRLLASFLIHIQLWIKILVCTLPMFGLYCNILRDIIRWVIVWTCRYLLEWGVCW